MLVYVPERAPEEPTAPPIRWAVVGRTVWLGGLGELGRVRVGCEHSFVLLGRECELFIYVHERLSVGDAREQK